MDDKKTIDANTNTNPYNNIGIINSGKLNLEKSLTGLGFKNSEQRLLLLYGNDGKINIQEIENRVIVDINIPLN
jgi:LytS/YehU family sensor histidine kinase